MLGGQNTKMPLGYTIVEVIIVLAISGMMFLIAANFINGKQEHTAFVQGTNDMVNQLQNIVNDVTDGHYSDIPIYCQGTSAAVTFPSGTPPSQGSNQSCVFWGKMMSFYGAAQPTQYQLFSLAASRSLTGGLPAGGTGAVSAIPGLTINGTIPQSLYIPNTSTGKVKVVRATGGTVTSYSIGFTQGLGATTTLSDGSTTYQSGTQDVGLVYDSALSAPATNYVTPNTENSSGSKVKGTFIRPAKSATICLSDGTRYARIFIGGTSNNSNQLSISAQQLGTTAC